MKTELIRLGLAGALFLAALIGYGFWYAAVSGESVTVANIDSAIAAKQDAARAAASAQQALSRVGSDIASMQEYFVPVDAVVSFVDHLQSLGASQGAQVAINSIAKSGTASAPSLSVDLSVHGSFDAVMRTVGAIEYLPYDLTASSVSVQYAEKSWTAHMTILVGATNATSSPAAAPVESAAAPTITPSIASPGAAS